MEYRVFILMLPCVAACNLSHNLQEAVTCQTPIAPFVFPPFWLNDILHKIHVSPYNFVENTKPRTMSSFFIERDSGY